MENTSKIKAIKYKNEDYKEDCELVVNDETLQLTINKNIKRNLSVLNNSLKEFITGYMLSEGIINSIKDIIALKIEGTKIDVEVKPKTQENQKITLCSDSSGGLRRKISKINKVKSDLSISKEEILENMERLRDNAIIWKSTGGCHVAAIVCGNQFIVKEDVSRHVAVDKVIGAGAYEGFDFSKSYIIYSGRMPADMVIKLSRTNIPILISNAAPSYSGIKIAEESNITLVGFVRGNRFNIYTHEDRIEL